MSGPDEEFEDFLARRRQLFRRSEEDVLEPPEDLDRIVLGKAREAIKGERPQRVYRGPGWGAPLALAATLLVAFTVVLQVAVPKKAPVPQVTVEQVAQRLDYAPEPMAAESVAPAASPNNSASGGADLQLQSAARREIPGGVPPLVSTEEASRYAPPPPPPPAMANTAPAEADSSGVARDSTTAASTTVAAAPPPSEANRALAKASATPAWRQDARTWLAEIERLRAEGKNAEADAEMAEYKRQHRAYAGAPDR